MRRARPELVEGRDLLRLQAGGDGNRGDVRCNLSRIGERLVKAGDMARDIGAVDEAAIGEIMKHGELHLTDAGADRPTLILTARHDAWVGYRQHAALLDAYPRATSIVVADAGHALPHERPELVGAALRDWLARC